MKESDIKYEKGDYWVLAEKKGYVVYQNKNWCAVSDSAYSKDADGLSLAIARCDYLAKVKGD